MSRRDDSHCKICKDNEGEDWLGCDACGQYFHASCLNVDYGETLQDMFYCPWVQLTGGCQLTIQLG